MEVRVQCMGSYMRVGNAGHGALHGADRWCGVVGRFEGRAVERERRRRRMGKMHVCVPRSCMDSVVEET